MNENFKNGLFLLAFVASIIVVLMVLIYALTPPNCPSGTVAVYGQYSGWKCLAGANPL